MLRVLKNDSALYLFINWKKNGLWQDELTKVGFNVKNCIVWDKVVHGLNYQNYAYTHEFIIFATKGRYLPKNKQGGQFWRDVWHIQRQMTDNQSHETMKCLDVVAECIKHGSKEGDLILDPFAGVCSIPLACKILKRDYIGIELMEKYFKICNERLDAQAISLF